MVRWMGVIQSQFQKFKLKGSISEASLNRGTTLNRVYYFYYSIQVVTTHY